MGTAAGARAGAAVNLRKLAELIRARREALHMTREQVAAAAGCHWRTVENLERCDHDTRWGVAVAVAEVVGVTIFCVEHFSNGVDTELGPPERPLD